MSSLHKQRATRTTKRAVLYARVSSDDRAKDGRNLQGQIEMCREYALGKGYRIAAELSEDDRGASGASFELPQLNRVLEMAQADEFGVLVVREIDRLSRSLAKQLIVEEELRRCGVLIEYALAEFPDTPEGRLNKHIRATIAEYEREKITERMTRGRRNKVKAGNVMVADRPPYGYRIAEKDGRTSLAVYEPEARVVRLIFSWYVHGDDEKGTMSIGEIASQLSALRIPTFADTGARSQTGAKKRGRGQWCKSSVGTMLRSETHAGIWHYGKRTDPDGSWQKNPREYWLAVAVPAIVSRELWEAAQAQLEKNRENARRNLKHKYLLSKRVTCGNCGKKMRGGSAASGHKVYRYYRCPATSSQDYVPSCDAPNFRADGHVDAAVWEWIRCVLTNPTALAEGLNAYKSRQDKEYEPIRERLAVMGDLLDNNRQQLERLLDLYLSGDLAKEMLIDRKSHLETKIARLDKEQADLIAHLQAQTLTETQIQSIQEFAAKVAQGLETAENSFKIQRRIVEALDLQVTLAVEDGKEVAYLQCVVGEGTCTPSNSTGCLLWQIHYVVAA